MTTHEITPIPPAFRGILTSQPVPAASGDLSSIVARILRDLPESYKEAVALRRGESFLRRVTSESNPVSDTILNLVLDTNFVESSLKEGDIIASIQGLFACLLSNITEFVSYKDVPCDILKVGTSQEELRGLKDGVFQTLAKDVERPLSRMDRTKDIANGVGDFENGAAIVLKKMILSQAKKKLKELETIRLLHPNSIKIKTQIDRLKQFVYGVQGVSVAELTSDRLGLVKKGVQIVKTGLKFAEDFVSSDDPLAKTLKQYGKRVGCISSVLGVYSTGKASIQAWKKSTQYEQWLKTLQNLGSTDFVARRATQHEEERRVCRSAERALERMLATSSIKNGITNLAMRKQALESASHPIVTCLAIGTCFKAVVAATAAVLGILSLIGAPVTTWVALGTTLIGLFILGIRTYRSIRANPALFRASWCALESWIAPFRTIQSQWYRFQIARLEAKKALIESKIAPTCYKIAFLGKLATQYPAASDRDRVVHTMALLEKKSIQDGRNKLSGIEEDLKLFSQKRAAVESSLRATDNRMKALRVEANMAQMKASPGWERLEQALERFMEGMVDTLVRGVGFSQPVLDELKDSTGIDFDVQALESCFSGGRLECRESFQEEKRARAVYDRARQVRMHLRSSLSIEEAEANLQRAHQQKMEVYKPLLQLIRKPICSFLMKEEQDLKKLKI